MLNNLSFTAINIKALCSGAGTNLKVGGTGPARSAEKNFFTVPPHFLRVSP